MTDALAVEALLHLVRVLEAAAAAERSADRHDAEVLDRWQDEIGRARADVMWQLGERHEDWGGWLARRTSVDGFPRDVPGR